MTPLGGKTPKINTGAISPGVITAESIRVGSIGSLYDDTARDEAAARRYWTGGLGSTSITWDTITIDVPFVSPEVIRLMWGQPPYGHEFDGETLL